MSRPRTKAVTVSDLFIVGRTDCLRWWSSLLISWLMSSLSSQVWQGWWGWDGGGMFGGRLGV